MSVKAAAEIPYVEVAKPIDVEAAGHETPDIKGYRKNKVSQDIAWCDVSFSVKQKQILKNCYGRVKSNDLCAIMGPSGAGKSSLLNVLAGRSSTSSNNTISGTIAVGGKKINPTKYRKYIAYVMQEDALLPTSSPREALEFSANLRLPRSTDRGMIKTIASELLKALDLEQCADVMIGGGFIKGISGGQRKRTSVGIELIIDPPLLFLDEPTSGLDSYTAKNLVELLKAVAAKNTTILCTIHQPSSEVFAVFDSVIFMKEGVIMYHGAMKELVSFFSNYGYPCPIYSNPSDFVMYLAQTVELDHLEKVGLLAENSKAAMAMSSELAGVTGIGDFSVDLSDRVGFFFELKTVLYRTGNDKIRDKGALIAAFTISGVLNTIFGLIFFQVGRRDDSNYSNFTSHMGALVFVHTGIMFASSSGTALEFPSIRPLFMREYSVGTYSATSFFLSKTLLEMPVLFALQLYVWLIVYFLMGLRGNYILLVLNAFGLGMASSSVAILLGCFVGDVKSAAEFLPIMLVPQLLFAGFFIQDSAIPVFLRWAQYVCSLKYAINIATIIEFGESSKNCQGGAAINCATYKHENDMYDDYWWIYMIILIAFTIILRVLGTRTLALRSKRFY